MHTPTCAPHVARDAVMRKTGNMERGMEREQVGGGTAHWKRGLRGGGGGAHIDSGCTTGRAQRAPLAQRLALAESSSIKGTCAEQAAGAVRWMNA